MRGHCGGRRGIIEWKKVSMSRETRSQTEMARLREGGMEKERGGEGEGDEEGDVTERQRGRERERERG